MRNQISRRISRSLLALAGLSLFVAPACYSGVFEHDLEAIEASIGPGCQQICDRMAAAGCGSARSSCLSTCETRLRSAFQGDDAGCVTAVKSFLECCPASMAAVCASDNSASVDKCSCGDTSNLGDCASGTY